MAEGICRKILSEKLGCGVDRLEDFGYKIFSAGVMAANGVRVSNEASIAMSARGIDISGSLSTLLTEELVDESDIIFVMSQSHREYVLRLCEKAGSKCFLLDGKSDIEDPIGAGREIYERCAERLEKLISKRIGELLNESSISK